MREWWGGHVEPPILILSTYEALTFKTLNFFTKEMPSQNSNVPCAFLPKSNGYTTLSILIHSSIVIAWVQPTSVYCTGWYRPLSRIELVLAVPQRPYYGWSESRDHTTTFISFEHCPLSHSSSGLGSVCLPCFRRLWHSSTVYNLTFITWFSTSLPVAFAGRLSSGWKM